MSTNSVVDDHQEPDESLAERLWGLTEMFPDGVRNACGAVSDFSVSSVKNVFQFSCNASWVFFTSSMILFAPIIFETERAQMEEMQRTQQKQVRIIFAYIFVSFSYVFFYVQGSSGSRFGNVTIGRYARVTANGIGSIIWCLEFVSFFFV